jgi:tetratricopeptide (TPR) repeat protein
MAAPRTIALDAVRTDGWFERIGESIGSFQALCDIVGERFFAFSLVAGVRITALTVDRRTPDATIVEFVAGEEDGLSRRVSLPEFRRQLVGALLTYEPSGPAPARDTDVDAIQAHIGIRYLLLAPLFGISLRKLILQPDASEIVVQRDGFEEVLGLEELRIGIGALVRQELERAQSGARGAIDLSKVAEAETAAAAGDSAKVVSLLGSWPAPLAIFLRTPEGQALAPDARQLIAKGLGLLGTACAKLGESPQAEEILRLGIQYAGESALAGELFRRLGEAFLTDGRPGEAIAPLRRALVLGAPERDIMPLLARAYLRRGRHVAAMACVRRAIVAGAPPADVALEQTQIERHLGIPLTRWQALMATPAR